MSRKAYVDMSLSGWGRYPQLPAKLYRPEDVASVLEIINHPGTAPVLGRGRGKSYGDASFVRDGSHISTPRLNRFLSFDANSGVLECESGVSLDEIISVFLPRGWFLPVTPGTKLVSIGGAIACDVHGKNHHRDGSISNHVEAIKLITADGRIHNLSRYENAELFFATTGGMGLTGFILEVTLKLLPVETAFIKTRKIKCRSLDETIEQLAATEQDYRYSVSWLDSLSKGRELGRSILILGNHATRDDLPASSRSNPLPVRHGSKLAVAFDMPEWLLNSTTVGAFNTVYYLSHGPDGSALTGYDPFFYPLDSINDWNRLYGKRGFVQYQCVIPEIAGAAGLRKVLEYTTSRGLGSFLAVLKRLRAETAPLAFPMDGYTLTLDLPVRAGTIGQLNNLDQLVAELGGRIYLAKDAILSAEMFRIMYPRFAEWLRIKKTYDPDNLFTSALSQRLRMFEN